MCCFVVKAEELFGSKDFVLIGDSVNCKCHCLYSVTSSHSAISKQKCQYNIIINMSMIVLKKKMENLYMIAGLFVPSLCLQQEVIDLTKDLLASQPSDSASTTNSSETVPFKHNWKTGDKCLAVWSNDGQ